MLYEIFNYMDNLCKRINGNPEISLHYRDGPNSTGIFFMKVWWNHEGYEMQYMFSTMDLVFAIENQGVEDTLVEYINQAYRKKVSEDAKEKERTDRPSGH